MKQIYKFKKDKSEKNLIIILEGQDFLSSYGLTHSNKYNPKKHIEKIVSKHFNEFYGVNFTYTKIKNHLIEQFDFVKDNGDKTFNLIDMNYCCSINNKYSDYVFIEATPFDFDRVLSIDFETANAKRTSVCSIGYVLSDSGEVVESGEILVNPDVEEFSPINVRVHGIRKEHVKGCDKWDIAWEKVRLLINEDTLVIGHNLKSMEMACIKQEYERYGMKLEQFYALDTLYLSKAINTDIEKHKLDILADKYGVELEHHNALSDANACLEIYYNLIGKVDVELA